jgi:hypothetical protein
MAYRQSATALARAPSPARRRYTVSTAVLSATVAAIALLTYILAFVAIGSMPMALVTATVALLPLAAILAQEPVSRLRSR